LAVKIKKYQLPSYNYIETASKFCTK